MESAMHCASCGAPLQEGLCPNCAAAPAPAAAGLRGWSDKLADPTIVKMAERQKKGARMFGNIFAIVFVAGFFIAGLLIPSIPLKSALLIGVSLGVLMFLISRLRLFSLSRPVWEGRVEDKSAVEHFDKKHPDKAVIRYTVLFRGEKGGKKKLRSKGNAAVYEYYNIGDRVRYYPAFGSFEKFDKSKDSYIFCNVCSAQNDIGNRKCSRCKSPLFK